MLTIEHARFIANDIADNDKGAIRAWSQLGAVAEHFQLDTDKHLLDIVNTLPLTWSLGLNRIYMRDEPEPLMYWQVTISRTTDQSQECRFDNTSMGRGHNQLDAVVCALYRAYAQDLENKEALRVFFENTTKESPDA